MFPYLGSLNTEHGECTTEFCNRLTLLLPDQKKNIVRSQCMSNSQYRRQHYITYHGYKCSLPNVAGFIRQSGDYYLCPPPETSGGQGNERVKRVAGDQGITRKVTAYRFQRR